MKEKRDNLKIIEAFAGEQEIKTDVLSKAKELATKKYGNKQKKSLLPNILTAFSSLAVVIVFIISIVISTPNNTEIPVNPRYLIEDALSFDTIVSIGVFCNENELDVKYFDIGSIDETVKVFNITDTNEFVFFVQEIYNFGLAGIDLIELSVCVTIDEFERFDSYSELTDSFDYNGITVYKNSEFDDDDEQYTIMSRFEVDNTRYYLKIVSFLEESLSYYLELLI